MKAEIDVKSFILKITITDHEPGVPPDKLKALFQPYFRLPYGQEKNPGGNGLGLMTARHLARSHGGELELNNGATGGLEAKITFPVTGTGIC